MARKRTKKPPRRLAVLDFETDPFKYGFRVMPFAAGFYDGIEYRQFWGDACIAELMRFLEAYPEPLIIYAHNGGKFDFWFIQDFVENPLFFIHSRLVKAKLYHHELRDSFSIIPVPQDKFFKGAKTEIDYETFTYQEREKPANKKRILDYLYNDCLKLFQMLQRFCEEFGTPLTMPSLAMKQLKKEHPQEHRSEAHDEHYRQWYFGGRVQCFASGEQSGDFKLYDVNSLYPDRMANADHPHGVGYIQTRTLPDSGLYFAEITATSQGHLPVATKFGLSFPTDCARFFICSHELNVALKYGLVKIHQVHRVFIPKETQRFTEFVDKFMQRKLDAEALDDQAGRLHNKLIANSAYGKFAANPRRYKDTEIFPSLAALNEINEAAHEELLSDYTYVRGDEKHQEAERKKVLWRYAGKFGDNRVIAERPAKIRSYSFQDVAIGASITSAARAVLLEAIMNSVRPIYCDTDSLICESLNLPLHATEIGAWKTEATFNRVYIAGKKMYACFQLDESRDGPEIDRQTGIKKASKGVQFSFEQIQAIALGYSATVHIPAPVLRIGKDPGFITRTIASTIRT